MKKIFTLINSMKALGLVLCLLPNLVWGQTNNYFGTSGTLSGNVWSTNPAGPYTSALPTTGGAILNFGNATTSITGGSITTIAGINATANASITSISGTLSNQSNGVIPVNVSAGITLDLGTQALTTSATAGYTKNGAGTLAMGGSTYGGGFTLNAGTFLSRGNNAFGSGAVTFNGGTIAANTNRVIANPTSITIGGDLQFGEIPANVPLASNVATISFSDNVALGASLRTFTLGNSAVHTFSGVISNTGSDGITFAANANGSAGSFVLTGANTYSGTTTVSGGTLRLASSGTIPIENSVTISGGTLKVSTSQTLNNLTLSSGTLTVDAGVTLTINGTFNYSGGTISNTGIIAYGASSTLSYSGSATQTTANEFPSTNGPANLTINNSAGVTLAAARTLTGTLTFTGGGKLTLGANTLTVNGTATGGSSAGWVVTDGAGTLTIPSFTGAKTFPIGQFASSYDPVTITPTSAATFAVKVGTQSTALGTNSANDGLVVNREWDITRTGTASSTNLAFTSSANTKNNSTTRPSGSVGVVGHYNIGLAKWDADISAAYASNTWTVTTYTGTFSPFIVASPGAVLSAELLDIAVKTTNTKNIVSWSTASEKSNAQFDIQRSANGETFTTIGTVKGSGTTNATSNYTFEDATPALGTNYYRLRQVDTDETATLSKVVSVQFNGNGKSKGLKVYPTLAADKLNVVVESDKAETFNIINLLGQTVLTGRLTNATDINISALAKGTYMLQVAGDIVKFAKN